MPWAPVLSGKGFYKTKKLEEAIAHGDLSDMPDTGGTNSDHDARYLKLDQTTPQVTVGTFTFPNIKDSGLTSGRVTFAGTAGLLSDSANFVWDNVNSRLGIGQPSPTALIHLRGGTTAAGTAPIKLTAGNLLTSAEAGAIEYLSDKLYLTIDTGPARKEIALNDAALTGSCVVYTTNLGRLTTSTNLAYDGSSLTATVGTNKKLEFFSRSGNPCFRITNGTGNVSFWDMSSASMEIINQSSSGAIHWGTNDTIRMTITAAGSVYVGTTTAIGSGVLQVVSPANDVLDLQGYDQTGILWKGSTNSGGADYYIFNGAGGFYWYDNTNNHTAFAFDTTYNVYFGTDFYGGGGLNGGALVVGANAVDGSGALLQSANGISSNWFISQMGSDPTTAEGMFWYRTDLDELRCNVNGTSYRVNMSPILS